MTHPTRSSRSPSLATFLSFLWPGLGHWYLARPRAALVYALPVLVVAAIVVIRIATTGLERFALELFDPSFASTALILGILLGLWRLVAMGDVFAATPARGARRRPATAVLGVLALVVVIGHGALGYMTWSFYEAGSRIFVNDDGDELPFPSEPATSDELVTADPAESPGDTVPAATPGPASSRVTILLTGIDSSPTRRHALNDTIMVVSVDPDTKTVAMVSIPRDIGRFKLPDGRRFDGKINSLASYVRRNPGEFKNGPTRTLMDAVGYLIGVRIDYYAAVDLAGFVRMIDLVGGVTVVNDRAINDPVYGGWTDGRRIGFRLSVGRHTLDGQEALAYARSRMGAGDSDFSRARRQQKLLIALARKMADPAMLPKLPAILSEAGNSMRTSFPADRLSEMLDLARSIDEKAIRRVVLGPSYSTRATNTSEYMLVPDMKKIARISVSLFGDDSRWAEKPPAGATSPPGSPAP